MSFKTEQLPKTALLLILAVKSFAILMLILYGIIHLGPDEAQYWTWSRNLDWGYYSKPPGIAWQIWLGTQAFGQTELGVRIGAVAISILITFAVYYLARSCGLSEKHAAWGAIIMALAPLGILSSLFAITDGGMVLFWTLALAFTVQRREPNDLVIGLLIACGALFKWPIYFFWLIRLLWGGFNPPVISKKLILGVLISLLGLIPSIIWNYSHDWVTFKHVYFTLFTGELHHVEHPGPGSGNPFEFLGAQAALLSPIFFIFLLISLKHMLTRKNEIPFPVWFCGFTSLVIITGALLLSLTKKLQGNWIVFAYPGAMVWIAYYAIEKFRHSHAWLSFGAIVGVLLCIFILLLPNIQSIPLFEDLRIPYRINPFRHNLGWEKIAPALKNAGYDPNKDFLFSDKYQTTSILSFYGPEQKQAYFLNLQGTRLNQFSFWPGMENEIGKTGFFVFAENVPKGKKNVEDAAGKYLEILKPYFSEVIIKGPYPLFKAYGGTVKEAWIFEGIDYNGKVPPSINKY